MRERRRKEFGEGRIAPGVLGGFYRGRRGAPEGWPSRLRAEAQRGEGKAAGLKKKKWAAVG